MTFRVMGLWCGIDRETTFDAELQAFVAGPIANRLSEDRALLLGMSSSGSSLIVMEGIAGFAVIGRGA